MSDSTFWDITQRSPLKLTDVSEEHVAPIFWKHQILIKSRFVIHTAFVRMLETTILSRVSVTKDGVHIGNWINNLQVVTTNNYYIITHLHNLRSLHTNLLSLSPPVFTDL
jgi:hypothetical protein